MPEHELAAELVNNGWHIKPIQRLIVLSATYCQSANVEPSSTESRSNEASTDAANDLLSHARRRRLEGEELRDAMLQIAGQSIGRLCDLRRGSPHSSDSALISAPTHRPAMRERPNSVRVVIARISRLRRTRRPSR